MYVLDNYKEGKIRRDGEGESSTYACDSASACDLATQNARE